MCHTGNPQGTFRDILNSTQRHVTFIAFTEMYTHSISVGTDLSRPIRREQFRIYMKILKKILQYNRIFWFICMNISNINRWTYETVHRIVDKLAGNGSNMYTNPFSHINEIYLANYLIKWIISMLKTVFEDIRSSYCMSFSQSMLT